MKFIAIGELMLRLSPPNYEKIVTTHNFIVNYGGAEANVAVSLANLGVDSTFFTVLPNTDLGKSCINYLKARYCGNCKHNLSCRLVSTLTVFHSYIM